MTNPRDVQIPVVPSPLPVDPPFLEIEDARASWQPADARTAAYRPFPTDCLPDPVRDFVDCQSAALGCDPAAVALPVLSVLASCIGSTRRIRLKRTWMEPAVLWTALVPDPGIAHSPPLDAAVLPLVERQEQVLHSQGRVLLEYEKARAKHRSAMRRYNGLGRFPQAPREPKLARHLTRDYAISKLVPILERQDRGVLVCSEDLDGWLGRSHQGRTGADPAHWLDVSASRPMTVERRGNVMPVCLPVPSASVTGTLTSDVLWRRLSRARPGDLVHRLLVAAPPPRPRRWTDDDLDEATLQGYAGVVNTLFSLQFVPVPERPPEPTGGYIVPGPPRRPLTPEEERLMALMPMPEEDYLRLEKEQGHPFPDWMNGFVQRGVKYLKEPPNGKDTSYEVDPPEVEMVSEFIGRRYLPGSDPIYDGLMKAYKIELDRHKPEVIEEVPIPIPLVVELSDGARKRFAQFVNEFGEDRIDIDVALQASFVHLESIAARLALVLHLSRWGAGEAVDPAVCDEESLSRGIELAQWFGYERLRLYAQLGDTADECRQRDLLDWLLRRGGEATARDLCRSNSRAYPTMDAADQALEKLVYDHVGVWLSQPAGMLGGRPCRMFSMHGEAGSRQRAQERPLSGHVTQAKGENPGVVSDSAGAERAQGKATPWEGRPTEGPASAESQKPGVVSDSGGANTYEVIRGKKRPGGLPRRPGE